MSTPAYTCARCKNPIHRNDNIKDIYSVSMFQVVHERTRSIRLFGYTFFGPSSRLGERILRYDEEKELCSDCSYLLIGRFLQGRSTEAIQGKAHQ